MQSQIQMLQEDEVKINTTLKNTGLAAPTRSFSSQLKLLLWKSFSQPGWVIPFSPENLPQLVNYQNYYLCLPPKIKSAMVAGST